MHLSLIDPLRMNPLTADTPHVPTRCWSRLSSCRGAPESTPCNARIEGFPADASAHRGTCGCSPATLASDTFVAARRCAHHAGFFHPDRARRALHRMKIKVLGSSAGGGFPQRNCNCRHGSGGRLVLFRSDAHSCKQATRRAVD